MLMVLFACMNINNSILARQEETELVYDYKYYGIAKIHNALPWPVIFSPEGESNYYYRSDKIYKFNFNSNETEVVFDPILYFQDSKPNNSKIEHFTFIDNRTILSSVKSNYYNDTTGWIINSYKVVIDTTSHNITITEDNITPFYQYYFHERAIAYREMTDYIEIKDYKNNTSRRINKIDGWLIGQDANIYQISVGRNPNEVVYTCFCQEVIDGQRVEVMKVVFYDLNNNEILKIYTMPQRAVNNDYFYFNGGRIYMMPNKKELIIFHHSNGLWLYSLEKEELYCLIYWNENHNLGLSIMLNDFSWDSKRILISRNKNLYLLDIPEYLFANPSGNEIFIK